MWLFDQYYIMLVLPALALSLIAQVRVKWTFSKYGRVGNAGGMTGADIAVAILGRNGVSNVRVELVQGRLTDHYDPRKRVIRLSNEVYGSRSVAALGIAAHEAGHALQHARKYKPLMLRGTLVPAANVGSNFGPYLAIAGLAFGFDILIDVGIILFAAAVLFYLITLPVEFNASRRAMDELVRDGALSRKELKGSKRVLSAAAMTYLAAAIVAFAQLARLILLRGRRR